eukprot:1145672-Pelagomonas_calceolata.AAC.3
MDYITLKHDVSELDKQVSDWRRKLELLQCAVCSVQNEWPGVDRLVMKGAGDRLRGTEGSEKGHKETDEAGKEHCAVSKVYRVLSKSVKSSMLKCFDAWGNAVCIGRFTCVHGLHGLTCGHA